TDSKVVDRERYGGDGSARGGDHDRGLCLREHTGERRRSKAPGQARGRVILEELAEWRTERLDDARERLRPGPAGVRGSRVEDRFDFGIAEALGQILEEHPAGIAVAIELAVTAFRADAVHRAVRVLLEAACSCICPY